MIGLFRRTRGGIEAKLSRRNAALLADMFGSLLTLLESAGGEPTADPLEALVTAAPETDHRPDDPVLARLLPDAYADPGAAREFRRLTQDEVLGGKIRRIRSVIDTLRGAPGGHVVLDEGSAETWLAALNDLRLAVGTRMGLRADVDPTPVPPGEHPGPRQRFAFEWLGLLQETLVEALAGSPEG